MIRDSSYLLGTLSMILKQIGKSGCKKFKLPEKYGFTIFNGRSTTASGYTQTNRSNSRGFRIINNHQGYKGLIKKKKFDDSIA